jgi:predicted RNase H-related nuclease YkuK (DUF458 family)
MKNFKLVNGKNIDDLFAYVKNWVEQYPNSEIFVGCDSQEVGGKINYVTTVCLYEIGHGVHVVVRKESEPRPKNMSPLANLHPKLWSEVVKSVEVAEYLKEINKKITVHVDYNSKESEKSNQLYEAGIGYAKSMGYDAVGKPHAWAASCAADNYCR